jgi:hypothetical protein
VFQLIVDVSGYEQVRLAEDAALAGFIPLMFNCTEPMYTSKETDMVIIITLLLS